MNTFLKSGEFNSWLVDLKDQVGKALIIKRIRSAEAGNFGDCEPVGEGVSELRIHYGSSYRAYFTRRGEVSIFCCWAVISPPKNVISSAPRK